ncbi:hypothetical protein QBC40DRAFT_51917 [Triangularia verruculosa]|uniref:F-box domain-containing protein n=1 Tax=Triangularia verruculosa TaxID=2587418 RepID=A0AAN6XNK3_9PEZI|nr:hypothetical protein QBC40DRAFT_51917 [Triangularia verruculosa]
MDFPTSPMLIDDDRDNVDSLSLDTRLPRAERAQSIIHQADDDDEDENKATVELASIMTTTSNPVSPGPSSPPLDQVRMQDFIPPTRPSSTPFPQPEPRSTDLRSTRRPSESPMDLDQPGLSDTVLAPVDSHTAGLSLSHLPAEIHECILDHLFGFRVSTSSKSSITRWGTALRHPRRKELSELSRVSRTWRVLIQERLYRHIKLKATIDSLRGSFEYFAAHPHLRPYVKHVEIWFPVFRPKYGPLALSTANTLPTVTPDGLTTASYVLPMDNCSLEEAFYFVANSFPEVCIMTLEGGERRKAPKVKHWIGEQQQQQQQQQQQARPRAAMPKIDSVHTLICKGQWNLIRGQDDFESITSALPNLTEWQGSYSKPKSKSYLTMADIFSQQPMRLKQLEKLSLCLEGDYRREMNFPSYFLKVSSKVHFCSKLADAAAASPSLEQISYTGRVCQHFFNELVGRCKGREEDEDGRRVSRLKRIDLTVKNCCRKVAHWNESGSGITDMNFIKAFEQLVLAGIRALGVLRGVEYLRIRYVDLDSPVPPLNPYFLLEKGWCSGVWSDEIVAELNVARPGARFEELAESFGEVGYNKDGRMTISPDFPRSKSLSLKLSNYAMLSVGISVS